MLANVYPDEMTKQCSSETYHSAPRVFNADFLFKQTGKNFFYSSNIYSDFFSNNPSDLL